MNTSASQQVSFWEVHTWVQRYLDVVGDYPTCGTPSWCLLPDDSREKWAALLDFAQHHALRVETAQEQRAETAKAIASAVDWPAIARELRQRRQFYVQHPHLRRRAGERA
ncbi:DUF2742 domain-containing protein [[Mycobacterium] zoologicum]|uniref:DUF2742 domain-containing protein n=1 Tax=[Mycobacterium] zoologicum TaxID=2872311 RepID=UPI001CDAFAD0|nr:DUF2742 domain-containing protein [Mycolicibacter sp. MYC101]MEB3062475.1 DUF2742 domain-containing protein [Mycolicibacter sp. MYC101]